MSKSTSVKITTITISILIILGIATSVFGTLASPSTRGTPRSLEFLDASTGLPSGDYNFVAFGNFNGDSYVDMAFGGEDYGGTANTQGLYAYTGNGGTSWTSASTGLPGPGTDTFGGLGFGDADNDGNIELFAAYEGAWGSASPNGVGAWEYSGGTWSTLGITSPHTSGNVDNIVFMNITGNSGFDLLVTNGGSGLKYYEGSGSSPVSWTEYSTGLETSYEYTAATAADMNKDGRIDIIAGTYNNQGVKFYTQDAGGTSWTLQSGGGIPTSGTLLGVTVGDVNNDTHMDIVYGTHGGMYIKLGNSGGGTGTNFVWTTPTLASEGLPASARSNRFCQIQLADFDKDTDLDLLGPKADGTGGLHLYTGNGSANPGTNLAWTEVIGSGLATSGIYYGSNYADFDNDGDLDIGGAAWGNGGANAWLNNLSLAPPTVVSVSPMNGAVDVPITTEIVANFSKAMLPSSITTSTFILKDSTLNTVAGQIFYNTTAKSATFTPDNDLKLGETYEVTLLSTIQDLFSTFLDGNGNGTLEGSPIDDYVWTFTTSWNVPPSLTNMNVTPAVGDLSTEFEYSVIYWDSNNDTPELGAAYLNVHIDAELVGRAMNLNTTTLSYLRDGNFSNGEQYIYQTTLPSYGLHNYTFACFDGIDMNDTAIFDNPLVLAKPVIAPINDLMAFEDIDLILDLTDIIHDDDTNKNDLEITINSSYADLVDLNITFNYPNEFNYPSGRNYEIVAINVSDTVFEVNRDVKVNVVAVNDAPQISGLSNIPVNEDQQYVLDVSTQVSDIDNAHDELTISTNSSYALVTGKNITFYYPVDSGILYEYVKIEVDDGDLAAHQNITVTVIPEGVLFVLLPIPDKYTFEDTDLVVDMEDYLTPGDGVSINDLVLEINSSYGVVSGTELIFNYPNSFNYPSGRSFESVEVNVSLPDQAWKSTSFKINVQPVNDAPYLTNADVSPDTGDENTQFTFSVNYIDIDGSENQVVNVVIDDSSYAMTYITGNKNLVSEGASYQFSTELLEGVWNYYFECDDMASELNSKNSTSTYSLTVTGEGEEPPVSNDTDDDGMPDWYEDYYGFDKNDPSDAALDSDGDQFTNLQEYLGKDGKPGGNDHTNPNNPTDYPKEITGGEDGDGGDKETDDLGFWLAIGIVIIVIVIVLIIVAVLVMKRRKAPEPYPYPPQQPPAQPIEELPLIAAPVAPAVATEAQPQPAEYYPPPAPEQQQVPLETYEQPYDTPVTTDQGQPYEYAEPPPTAPQEQPLEDIPQPAPQEPEPVPAAQPLMGEALPLETIGDNGAAAPMPTEETPAPPPAAEPQATEQPQSPKPASAEDENVI